MAARRPEQILDDVIQAKGRGASVRRKMAANRENNWLLALTLHSFVKSAEGAKLSDAESTLVDAFRANGFSEDDIRQHGTIARRIPQAMRDEIFPRRFARLDGKQSYSLKDLERDAPEIVQGVLSKPNVNRVDVAAIHAGRASLRDFPMPRREVMAEYGSSMLVAVEPNQELTGKATTGARYTIKASSFRCVQRAGDSIFNPKNEPYWIFGSLGAGTTITTRSSVFEDIDSGDTRSFSGSEGCVWGQNCSAQTFPDGEIGSLISLFEHDEGDTVKIKAGFAAAFAGAAGVLVASGVAAWVGAVVAGVGVMVQWLLTFLDDDHIADNTFVFTRDVVAKQVPNVGSTLNMSRTFTDGDGNYSLTLKITHAS